MSASSGLIVSIMISTPRIVSTAHTICVRLCWSVVEMLSMSFVTFEHVAARAVVERSAAERRAPIDVLAQPELIRCAIPAIRYCCAHPNAELIG
jgi:hypothetical protein